MMNIDVDEDGCTSGYLIETYLQPIDSVQIREGEEFVRIAADTGGGVHSEIRLSFDQVRKLHEAIIQ